MSIFSQEGYAPAHSKKVNQFTKKCEVTHTFSANWFTHKIASGVKDVISKKNRNPETNSTFMNDTSGA
jgi:hypothetical protein